MESDYKKVMKQAKRKIIIKNFTMLIVLILVMFLILKLEGF